MLQIVLRRVNTGRFVKNPSLMVAILDDGMTRVMKKTGIRSEHHEISSNGGTPLVIEMEETIITRETETA